jgi:hypothetical protein
VHYSNGLTPSSSVGALRKARWSDAEPALSQLLALLPLLPPALQPLPWQTWGVVWQTVNHMVFDDQQKHPTLPTAEFVATHYQRRQADAVPYMAALLSQLPHVSAESRHQWATQTLTQLGQSLPGVVVNASATPLGNSDYSATL